MKRPLLWTAAGMPAGICVFLNSVSVPLILSLILLLSLILIRVRKILCFYLLLGVFLGGFTGFCYRQSIRPLRAEHETVVALSGVVKETYDYGFLLRIDRYDFGQGSYRVNPFYTLFVTVSADDVPAEYSRVIVEGTVEVYTGPDNPGQFDAKSYYSSVGSLYRVNAGTIRITKSPGGFRKAVRQLREKVAERIIVLFPNNTSGLPAALLLGDKGQMEEERKSLYEQFGLAHILTVSGLHIGLLSNLLLAFFLIFFDRKHADRITLFVLILYGFLCGFRISCIRAIFTFLISCFAGRLKRSFDRISANSFLLIVILFLKPYMLTNLSFQLSFGAGYLLAFSEIRRNMVKTKPGRVLTILRTSTILQIGLLPIQLQQFYTFAPCGIVLNLLLLCVIETMFILSFLAVIVSFLLLPAGLFFAGPVYYLILAFEKVLSCFAGIRMMTIALGHQSVFRLLLFGVVFAAILWFDRRTLRKVWLCILPLWLIFLPNHRGFIRTANLSVGQGDCSVIMSGSTVIVIDCGSLSKSEAGEKILKPFLQYYGYSEADYLFLSHTDEDHINGIRNCPDVFGNLKGVFVDRTYTDTAELLKPAVNCFEPEASAAKREETAKTAKDSNRLQISYTYPGDIFRIGSINVRIFGNPAGAEGDENDRCQLLEVTLDGFSFLYLGDISKEVLTNISGEIKVRPYLIKIPHHGSIYSYDEAFYDTIRADVAVISVGRNNYGHPSQEVVTGLKKSGGICLITKENGAVITTVKKGYAKTTCMHP